LCGRDRAVVDERLQHLADAGFHLGGGVRRHGGTILVNLLDDGRRPDRNLARCRARQARNAEHQAGGGADEQSAGDADRDAAARARRHRVRAVMGSVLGGHGSTSLRSMVPTRCLADKTIINRHGERQDGAT
jgi:hypothetical protein